MRKEIFLFTLLILVNSCNYNQNPQENDNIVLPQYNIIVLLDLSDRILLPTQIERDTEIIRHLYQDFNSIAGESEKMFFNSKDIFKVKILEQQNTPYITKISPWEDAMDIDMAQIPFQNQSAPARKKRDETFYKTLNSIYSTCLFSQNNNDYYGADISKYFKQDLAKDLIKGAKNEIFILTDGYPVVEGKTTHEVKQLENLGYRFSPYKENTQIYFLELNPRDDPRNQEYSNLINDWSAWLTQAGFNAEDENYFQKNETNFNSVAEKINLALDLTKVAMVNATTNNVSEVENCQVTLASLINGNIEVNGQNINELVTKALSNCQVNNIEVDDGYKVRTLRNFLLVNFSPNVRSKYAISEIKIENGICYCKAKKI